LICKEANLGKEVEKCAQGLWFGQQTLEQLAGKN